MYCIDVSITVKTIPILIYTFDNDVNKTVLFWYIHFEARHSKTKIRTHFFYQHYFNLFDFAVFTKDRKTQIFVTCKDRNLCGIDTTIYFMVTTRHHKINN